MMSDIIRQTLMIPEILGFVLSYIGTRRDLARCARVNSLWHSESIKLLWKGSNRFRFTEYGDVPIHALAALTNDIERFKHYAKHIRHLRLSNKFPCVPPHRGRFLDDYMSISREELWTTASVQSVFMDFAGYSSSEHILRPSFCEPPAQFIISNVRSLQLSGCQVSGAFLTSIRCKQLKWLELTLDLAKCDAQSFRAFAQAHQALIGLECILVGYFTDSPEDYMLSLANHSNLLHLNMVYDDYSPSVQPLFSFEGGWTNLQSLNLNHPSISSSILYMRSPPPIRRLNLWGGHHFEQTSAQPLNGILRVLSRISSLEDVWINNCTSANEGLDEVIRSFGVGCPLLRILHITVELDVNTPYRISGETLMFLAKCCPNLIELHYDSPIHGNVVEVVQNITGNCPNLVALTLQMRKYKLFDLTELTPGSVESHLQRLCLISEIRHRTRKAVKEDELRSLLRLLKRCFPKLRAFHVAYPEDFENEETKEVMKEWKTSLMDWVRPEYADPGVLNRIRELVPLGPGYR